MSAADGIRSYPSKLSKRQIEDYNAIPAPRCPVCGGRLWFDYVTLGPDDGLQFKCGKGKHSVWMAVGHLKGK